MLEDVPVHGVKNEAKTKLTHQRNLSLDFRHVKRDIGPVTGCGHQRNRSLDSVLQRIPEDTTPTGDVARLAGSDDSGIHDDCRPPPPPLAARSRESLDSGNPEDRPEPPANRDTLLELIDSEYFNMSMAVLYLYTSKEAGVQSYIANKLFSFPPEEVDFYLPQLATMFIEMGDVAEMLRPYFVHRCKRGADFSLRLAWLLSALGGDDEKSRAAKLRRSILREEIRPTLRRGHHRSQSDASALRGHPAAARHLGDLTSGRAFDNGCLCSAECQCGAPRISPQTHFITALTSIGRRLATIRDKELRNNKLHADLIAVDLNLPARVWMPLYEKPHYVLRIPPHAATVLNSKDKAPYIMYVEVLETSAQESLPQRLLPPTPAPLPSLRHARSEDTLLREWSPHLMVDEDDCWAYNDEDFAPAPDAVSQLSAFSTVSGVSGSSVGSRVVMAVEVRRRLGESTAPALNSFRHDPADPSALALKESWENRYDRMRAASPYGSLAGWRLLGVIVKVGDDLRNELLAAQLLSALRRVWKKEHIPLRLAEYTVLVLKRDEGLIQPVLNTVSLHQIKKQSGASLRSWLEVEHGPPTSEEFLNAQDNFVRSAAAYALTSYLLQLKDRHNGNILLDSEGHIIHIDFGFILSMSPKNLGFESSPFKLTPEFVEVMDGEGSDKFEYFKILILKGLIAARKHADDIIHLVELMRAGSQLTCLRSNESVSGLRSRLSRPRTDAQLKSLVDNMVKEALHSYSTRLYDKYQYYTNGIL